MVVGGPPGAPELTGWTWPKLEELFVQKLLRKLSIFVAELHLPNPRLWQFQCAERLRKYSCWSGPRPSFRAVRSEDRFPRGTPPACRRHAGQRAVTLWQPPIPQSRGRPGAASIGLGPPLLGAPPGWTRKQTGQAPGHRTATNDVRAGNRRTLQPLLPARRSSGPGQVPLVSSCGHAQGPGQDCCPVFCGG